MSEVVSADKKKPQLNNVTQLEEYQHSEEINPTDLTDEEVINLMLAAALHDSVGSDPHRIARQLQRYLTGGLSSTPQEWFERTESLKVDVRDIDDDLYDTIAVDEIAKAGIILIRSKNGHYKGNEEIIDAARALINLRAGIVLQHAEIKDKQIDRWMEVIESLGRTATSVKK